VPLWLRGRCRPCPHPPPHRCTAQLLDHFRKVATSTTTKSPMITFAHLLLALLLFGAPWPRPVKARASGSSDHRDANNFVVRRTESRRTKEGPTSWCAVVPSHGPVVRRSGKERGARGRLPTSIRHAIKVLLIRR
jgi:hypothetical protein